MCGEKYSVVVDTSRLYDLPVKAKKRLPAIFLPLLLSLPLLVLAEADADARYLVSSGTISLSAGHWLDFAFDKWFGKNYEFCVFPSSGDPDLYTHYLGLPSTGDYEYASTNGGVNADCIGFLSAHDEWYYYSIYAYTDTEFTFHVYESD